MDGNSSASSVPGYPWLWAIEALASSETVDDVSLIIRLAEEIPFISDEAGKSTREVVSFMILEKLSAWCGRITTSVESENAAMQESKFSFDPEETCEDVIVHFLIEASSESNPESIKNLIVKYDIRSFVTHKRNCLPKCTLMKLKDAILGGSKSLPLSLKERSGVPVKNDSEHQVLADNSSGIAASVHDGNNGGTKSAGAKDLVSLNHDNEDDLEDSLNRNLFPHKRACSVLNAEDLGEQSHVNQLLLDNGHDRHLTLTKKPKHNDTCTIQVEARDFDSQCRNELMQDLSERISGHNGDDLEESSNRNLLTHKRASSALHAKDLGEQSYENQLPVDNGHDTHLIVTKKVKHDDTSSMQAEARDLVSHSKSELMQDSCERISGHNIKKGCDLSNEFENRGISQCKISEVVHNSYDVPQRLGHISSDVDFSNSVCDQNQMACNVELRASSVVSDCEILEKVDDISLNITQDNAENSPNNISNSSDGHHDEMVNDQAKPHVCLNAHSSHTQDSLAMSEWTEQNICMKCNKDHHLLVCASNSCPVMVHENCLGFVARLDEQGNFYCPFCAYSRAILEYREVKKKAAMAKKELTVFLGSRIKDQGINIDHSSPNLMQKLAALEENLGEVGEINAVKCVNCEGEGLATTNIADAVSGKDKQEGNRMSKKCKSSKLLMNQPALRQPKQESYGKNEGCESPRLQNLAALEQEKQDVDSTSGEFESSTRLPNQFPLEQENSRVNGERESSKGLLIQPASLQDEQENGKISKVCESPRRSQNQHIPCQLLQSPSLEEYENCEQKKDLHRLDIVLYVRPQGASVNDENRSPEEQEKQDVNSTSVEFDPPRRLPKQFPLVQEKYKGGRINGECEPSKGLQNQPASQRDEQEDGKISKVCESPRRSQNQHIPYKLLQSPSLELYENCEKQKDLHRLDIVLYVGPQGTSVNDEKRSSEELNDVSNVPKSSLMRRNPQIENTSPAVPQFRRRKLLWTKIEENTLKEGVQRFAKLKENKKVPWKKILEFGKGVFNKGRTAHDLKDKWRNLCKGSPNN